MIVQWCCKGLANADRATVEAILTDPVGLRCRGVLPPPVGAGLTRGDALQLLTDDNLDLHINGYTHPVSGLPFHDITPFISLSAGYVDRDAAARTNVAHPALRTALEFATTDFTRPGRPPCPGWVLYLYVLVSANRAVTVPAVAEEPRELGHQWAYSAWRTQGEVTAKINVPATQILCATRYEPADDGPPRPTHQLVNLGFTHPAAPRAEERAL